MRLGEIFVSQNPVWDNPTFTHKDMNLDPYRTSHTQVNSNWLRDLRVKNTKSTGRKQRRKALVPVGVGRCFVNRILNAPSVGKNR